MKNQEYSAAFLRQPNASRKEKRQIHPLCALLPRKARAHTSTRLAGGKVAAIMGALRDGPRAALATAFHKRTLRGAAIASVRRFSRQ